MAISVRFCLSCDPKWDFITFKMNILSKRERIVDTDVVNDMKYTRQSVITHVVIRFLARLDEVQEELLYYPQRRRQQNVTLKFFM